MTDHDATEADALPVMAAEAVGLRLWLRNRLARRADPPRSQSRGSFSKLARAYVVCPYCSIVARQIDPRAHLQGVAKQHFGSHLVSVHGIEASVAAKVVP